MKKRNLVYFCVAISIFSLLLVLTFSLLFFEFYYRAFKIVNLSEHPCLVELRLGNQELIKEEVPKHSCVSRIRKMRNDGSYELKTVQNSIIKRVEWRYDTTGDGGPFTRDVYIIVAPDGNPIINSVEK